MALEINTFFSSYTSLVFVLPHIVFHSLAHVVGHWKLFIFRSTRESQCTNYIWQNKLRYKDMHHSEAFSFKQYAIAFKPSLFHLGGLVIKYLNNHYQHIDLPIPKLSCLLNYQKKKKKSISFLALGILPASN